jgi:hypothetical protein
MSDEKPRPTTIFGAITVTAAVCAAGVSIWRQSIPVPPPLYRESGGLWKVQYPYAATRDDLTVEEVARRESQRLGRAVGIEEVEVAILMGQMTPAPVRIESLRVTYRVSPGYQIDWTKPPPK